MKKIYKFNLEMEGTQIIEVTEDYKILTCANQEGSLVMWVIVNLGKPKKDIQIEIKGTGQDIKELDALFNYWEYVNTVQMDDGLVWHVFNNTSPF